MITGHIDGAIELWDITNPRIPQKVAETIANPGGVAIIAISPDGRTLATGGADGAIKLWDIDDRSSPRVVATVTAHQDRVTSIAFGLNGHLLATTGTDHTVRLWEINDSSLPIELATIPAGDGYSVMAISPNGRQLALECNGSVQFWDINNPRQATLTGTTDNLTLVPSLAFSPDSHVLATLVGSDEIWLWDVTDLHRPVSRIDTEGRNVAFSHDGRWLAAGTEFWDISDIYHPRGQGALIGYPPRVGTVVFGPEDSILALFDGYSSTVDLKDIRQFKSFNLDDLTSLACRHAQTSITKTEWDQYFPGIDYRPPCE